VLNNFFHVFNFGSKFNNKRMNVYPRLVVDSHNFIAKDNKNISSFRLQGG
jgi:hypothetical protein